MIIDPDHAIIMQILAGHTHRYAELVDKHKRYTLAIALKVLPQKAEAEEAAQDAMVKAYRNLAAFNRESKFSTWLYRIVFNTAVSYRRKRRLTLHDLDQAADVSDESGHTLEKNDKQQYLHRAMAMLQESDRTALTLYYLEEFSLEEIADITGIPANTLKVRLHRARQRMAEVLKTLLQHEALTL